MSTLSQKLAERLGLPTDSSDETILATVQAKLENTALNEVTAAINSGKILAAHRDYWLAAFQADFRGTRAVLASLASPRSAPPVNGVAASAPLPAPAAPTVSEEDLRNARADAQLWALGFRDGVEAPPKVPWYELFPPGQTSLDDLLPPDDVSG